MAGFNTGVLTRKMFEYIDPKVAEPKKGQLLGRTFFSVKTLPGKYTDTYTYYWKERMGQVSDVTDRATDMTTTDVTYHKETGWVTEKATAIEYSQEEIERAAEGHIDVLGDKTQAANQALADWEDRLIFNGNGDERHPIYGLTSDPAKAGFQVADDAPITFDKPVDPTNQTAYEDATKIYNWLLDAANKITFLPGYTSVKPILAIPMKELSLLKRPYNRYSPHDTILNMIQDTANGGRDAIFSQVVGIPELEAQYWNTARGTAGKKDMGMIFINDPDTVQLVMAMEPQRSGLPELHDQKTKIWYKERTGGLSIKFPAGFVRLNGIN